MSSTRHRFELQFPLELVPALAGRFPSVDDVALHAAGRAARRRGHYTRGEFLLVCAWKTPRSRPKVASNSARAIERATRAGLRARDEAARMNALLALEGVGIPTGSTLLYSPTRAPTRSSTRARWSRSALARAPSTR